MPEKEQQFFGPERIPEHAPEKETEIERKRRLGKESEWTLALPLFRDLKKEGVFSYAEHTTKEVDEGEPKVDFVLGLEDGSHLAIQISLSESKETWKEKIKKIIGEDERGRPLGRPYEELKDIHPKPESLSRIARLERVPKIPLSPDWETVDNVYKRFEQSGRPGSLFDLLPQKRETEKELLAQALKSLSCFSSDQKLAKIFPELPSLTKQRYETLNRSYSKFLQREKIS